MIRFVLCVLALALFATPALTQQRLGRFGAWTAATRQEPTGKICYAFTRSTGRAPHSMLTVVHRPQRRDQVALHMGRVFRRETEVTVTVGTTSLDFYTTQGTAFARDGGAAVAAFRDAQSAVMSGSAANGEGTISHTFSLAGLPNAYNAISRECPPTASRRRVSS